jgi:hypothetical protein
MATFCIKCGKRLELVGRIHHCVLRPDAQRVIDDAIAAANPVANAANPPANIGKAVNASSAAAVSATTSTDKRRAYMRELMRKRRAAPRASSSLPRPERARCPAAGGAGGTRRRYPVSGGSC